MIRHIAIPAQVETMNLDQRLAIMPIQIDALIAHRNEGREQGEQYPAHFTLKALQAIRPLDEKSRGALLDFRDAGEGLPVVPSTARTALILDGYRGTKDVLYIAHEPAAVATGLAQLLVVEAKKIMPESVQYTTITEAVKAKCDPVPYAVGVEVISPERTAGTGAHSARRPQDHTRG
jgi:hypothetical protein